MLAGKYALYERLNPCWRRIDFIDISYHFICIIWHRNYYRLDITFMRLVETVHRTADIVTKIRHLHVNHQLRQQEIASVSAIYQALFLRNMYCNPKETLYMEWYISIPHICIGALGSVVGWDTMLQAVRWRDRIPMTWICFNLPNPASRTMVLGSTQPLTKMSNIRNLPGGKWRPGRKADNFTAICERTV
jgi:hypothetical protein